MRELGRKITTDTEEPLSKKQRECYLREQLQSIQRELGEHARDDSGASELRRQIEEARLPDEARREAERELGRLVSKILTHLGLSARAPLRAAARALFQLA